MPVVSNMEAHKAKFRFSFMSPELSVLYDLSHFYSAMEFAMRKHRLICSACYISPCPLPLEGHPFRHLFSR